MYPENGSTIRMYVSYPHNDPAVIAKLPIKNMRTFLFKNGERYYQQNEKH